MKLYPIIVIMMMLLLMVEALSRKKIIGGKKSVDARVLQNTTIEAAKNNEKITYPKKANSLKKRPTKSSAALIAASNNSADMIKDTKDVADIFNDLPADDLEFIKELDMQFKLHGAKLKIKVEHDNETELSKTAKRTIEHDLGYGYENNGYTYDKPKFMFYPYSQKDIPPSAPSYYPQYADTQDVTVVPSYSYELKPQTFVVQHDHSEPQIDIPHPQEHQAHAHTGPQAYHQEGAQEPVIILRIPGPTKYASHLQSLLQQYLEIRAAQYLRILQEAESRRQQAYNQQYVEQPNKQQHQQQHYEPLQPQHQHIDPPLAPPQDYVPVSHHPAPEQEQSQPSYPAIDDVYQTYKQRKRYQQQAYIEQQHHQQQQTHDQQNPAGHRYSQYEEENGPQQYYYPNEQQEGRANPQGSYQQIVVYEMAPTMYSNEGDHIYQQNQQYQTPQNPIYVHEEDPHYDSQNYDQEESGHLDISENNPRPTHTKVIFKHNTDAPSPDPSSSNPLPSLQTFERHVPTASQFYHQPYHQQNELDASHQQAVAESSASQKTASITPRPFNYHAHLRKNSNNAGRKRAVSTTKFATSKRVPIQNPLHTDYQFPKTEQYMQENINAKKTGSATEVKSKKSLKD